MPITLKTDLVQIISDICSELLPEHIVIDIYFSPIQTEQGEDADTALLQTDEHCYSVVINEATRYECLPDIIASQVACVLSHTQGGEAHSGGKIWKKYRKLFRAAWDLKMQTVLRDQKPMITVH